MRRISTAGAITFCIGMLILLSTLLQHTTMEQPGEAESPKDVAIVR
jgi:hypothetical protein